MLEQYETIQIEIADQHQVNKEAEKYTGKGIKIAVMDAAFNVNHPAFRDALSSSEYWFDGNQSETDFSSFYVDHDYHGNHCLGLIAGKDHNSGRPLGLAPLATLIPVIGMNCANMGEKKRLAYYKSLSYLKELDCHIINLSQEFLFEEASLKLLIEIVQQGKIIVYAAGNHCSCLDGKGKHSGVLQHPLLRKGLIVVGNLDKNDTPAAGYKSSVGSNSVSSNFRGNFIWVRGDERYSAFGKGYGLKSGTSMAAPTLAGAIALLWEQNPSFNNEQILSIVMGTGSRLTNKAFPKLNVSAMLSPELQQSILARQKTLSTASELLEQDKFPDIEITLSGLIFRKLTKEDITNYFDSDCLPLLKEEQPLLDMADYHGLYGLFQTIDDKQILVMPTAAFIKDNLFLFLKGFCSLLIKSGELFFNDLAYQLSQDTSLSSYESVYANWGEFAALSWGNKKIYNLRQPNLYYTYRFAAVKSEDNFPDVVINNQDIEHLNDENFLHFSKVPIEEIHDMLVREPDEDNYRLATSANDHIFDATFKNCLYRFKAFITKEKQIILTCSNSLEYDWYTVTRLLQTIQQKAKSLGFDVYFAHKKNYGCDLPFYLVELNPIPQEIAGTDYVFRSMEQINLFAVIGPRWSTTIGFLDLVKKGNRTAIEFYLNQGSDLNQIVNTEGENPLIIAIRYADLNIVKCLVEGGIDPRSRTKQGLSAIRFAEKLSNNEVAAYLKGIISDNQENRAVLSYEGITIDFQ